MALQLFYWEYKIQVVYYLVFRKIRVFGFYLIFILSMQKFDYYVSMYLTATVCT